KLGDCGGTAHSAHPARSIQGGYPRPRRGALYRGQVGVGCRLGAGPGTRWGPAGGIDRACVGGGVAAVNGAAGLVAIPGERRSGGGGGASPGRARPAAPPAARRVVSHQGRPSASAVVEAHTSIANPVSRSAGISVGPRAPLWTRRSAGTAK